MQCTIWSTQIGLVTIRSRKKIHWENLYFNLLLFRAQHKAKPATDNVKTQFVQNIYFDDHIYSINVSSLICNSEIVQY